MKISGNTLIELGYRPGKWFREALEVVNHKDFSEASLISYLDSLAPKIIDPFDKAKPFNKNIRAESLAEQTNVAKVLETMEEVMKIPTAIDGAVMPDACPTGKIGQIPVGGVVATKNAIHPSMHSADVCCSVMMTSFGKVSPKKVLDAAHSVTHFGGGGRSDLFEFPVLLEERILDNFYLNTERSLNLAKTHLGTQGDGNHFLYVGVSEETGETIMVTHHGSRGFGANLFKKGMGIAEKFRNEISPLTTKGNGWIPYTEIEGKRYWEALQVVREWTKLNHTVLHDATCRLVGNGPVNRF